MSNYGVNAEQIIGCGWELAVSEVRGGYPELWQALGKASEQAGEDGREEHRLALRLLSDATSMMLNAANTNSPFGAFFTSSDRRSTLVDDFDVADLTAMFEACKAIGNPQIKARLADIVWTAQVPRNAEAARIASDAYLKIPFESDTWAEFGSVDAWTRSISIMRQLGKAATERKKEVETALLQKARDAGGSDGFFLKKVTRLMLDAKLGEGSALEIAALLQGKANTSLALDQRTGRIYFEEAADWYAVGRDEGRRMDCLCAAAETHVTEADDRARSSHMVAASFYEEAIQAYRRVSKEARASRGLDKRIEEIHIKLSESGQKALGEMVRVSSGPIDLTDVAEDARASVRGLTVWNAIYRLARIQDVIDVDKQRQRAEKSIQSNPLSATIQKTHYGTDGRVVATTPGIVWGDAEHPDSKLTVLSEMIRNYAFELSVTVRGIIYPAYGEVLREHRVRLEDMIEIAKRSPIVPQGRAQLVGKALFFGFDGDFETALHLVVPQLEHIVRVQLNAHAVKTTVLNREGIENESGLSTIAALPEMDDIFGKGVSFEIRALFCSPYGPNLRNELAHGLLGTADCASEHGFYAWWFLLRLVVSDLVAEVARQEAEQRSKSSKGDGQSE